jgi:hypothetical protein
MEAESVNPTSPDEQIPDDEILLRVDVLFADLEAARNESDAAFTPGKNGAGGIEIGWASVDAASAPDRQRESFDVLDRLLDEGAAVAGRHPTGRIRITVTLVPDLTSSGIVLPATYLKRCSDLGAELAIDAQPSANWYVARFPVDASSEFQG